MSRTLQFRDNKEFYKELLNALKDGKSLRVETPFTRYSELPPKLRDIFDLDKHSRQATWVDWGVHGLFVAGITPSAATEVGMNYKPLYVLGGTAAGAAIGAGIGTVAGAGAGALPGAGIGAVIGLAAGVAAAAFADGKHKARVEIDKKGRISFDIEPVA